MVSTSSIMETDQKNGEASHKPRSSLPETNEEKKMRINEQTRARLEAIKAISLKSSVAEEIYIKIQSIDTSITRPVVHKSPVDEEKNRRITEEAKAATSVFSSVILIDEIFEEGNTLAVNFGPTGPRRPENVVGHAAGGETGATGPEAPTGGEPAPTSPTLKPQYWVDSVTALQTASAGAAISSALMFAGLGLFRTKALNDFDTCDGGTGVSTKVVSYSFVAVGLLWISLFLTFHITTAIRGYTDEDLADKRTRIYIKPSFVLNIVCIMLGIIFMGLSTFYFVQVRLGAWSCSSSEGHVVMMFIGLVMCFLELLLARSIYYVIRA